MNWIVLYSISVFIVWGTYTGYQGKWSIYKVSLIDTFLVALIYPLYFIFRVLKWVGKKL